MLMVGSSRRRRLPLPRFLELQRVLVARALERHGEGRRARDGRLTGRADRGGAGDVGLIQVQLVEEVGAQAQVAVELDHLGGAAGLAGVGAQRLQVARAAPPPRAPPRPGPRPWVPRPSAGPCPRAACRPAGRRTGPGRARRQTAARRRTAVRRSAATRAGRNVTDGGAMTSSVISLCLAELEQDAAGGLGVDERDQVAAGADSGRFVDQRDALCLQLGEGGMDVLDLEADVVQARAPWRCRGNAQGFRCPRGRRGRSARWRSLQRRPSGTGRRSSGRPPSRGLSGSRPNSRPRELAEAARSGTARATWSMCSDLDHVLEKPVNPVGVGKAGPVITARFPVGNPYGWATSWLVPTPVTIVSRLGAGVPEPARVPNRL